MLRNKSHQIKIIVLREVNFITITVYKLIIGAISLLYVYEAYFVKVNIISGILLNLFCLILVIYFRSYSLFYVSLMVLLIISCRYYNKKKSRIGHKELLSIFAVSLIEIAFSVYAIFQMLYYYPLRFPSQAYKIFISIIFVETIPVVYMIIIYTVIIILILSIHKHLSIGNKYNVQPTIIKITIAAIAIVFIIIAVNAVIYFIIHNFPSSQLKGIFDGNFLKDPIKYYYRLPKHFSDCLWFSATTFFTVGYGDMHPVGNIMYLLTMMEMVSAYALGIIMIPVLLLKISNN
jgi:voltage-gated potassium channel